MPAFLYRAVDSGGRAERGVIEASNAAGARRSLRERRLLPISVEATTAPAAGSATVRSWWAGRRRRIGARALATVTHQLSTLVGSDVRIEDALTLVSAQADAPVVSAVLLNLRGAILDGRSFASALADHPAAFPGYYRASIAAAEQSGRLGDVMAQLADFVESRHRTAQKIKLALLYPALLATVSMGMMILLLIYVVPDIVRVFVSRGADLPLLTRGLIGLSAGFQAYGWLLAIVIVGAVFAARRWLAWSANRLAFDRFLSQTPPFARFSRQLNAARFAGSLSMLVQSAVPLVDAIDAAAAVTPNRHIRGGALQVAARVREGESLNRAMQAAGVFPAMLVAIVASGENSDRLASALGRAAAELEHELDALVSVLVALVEPAVLLLMGGVVLLMVLAILLPIINLNNLVGM